ncbi:unnamed protein product [Cunninghamella blakesleeana]
MTDPDPFSALSHQQIYQLIKADIRGQPDHKDESFLCPSNKLKGKLSLGLADKEKQSEESSVLYLNHTVPMAGLCKSFHGDQSEAYTIKFMLSSMINFRLSILIHEPMDGDVELSSNMNTLSLTENNEDS